MAVTYATSKEVTSSAYQTYKFQRTVSLPKTLGNGNANTETNARTAGFYFEALLITDLNKLFNQNSYRKSNRGVEYDANQKNAVAAFNRSRSSSVLELKKQVDSAAFLGATQIFKRMEEKLGSLGLQNISMGAFNVEAGSATGDFHVKFFDAANNCIDDVVFEAKWQSSSARNTRWFGPLSDETLFKSAFLDFLQRSEYWDHSKKEEVWIPSIRTTALEQFIKSNVQYSNAKSFVQFLLKKGNYVAKETYSEKYVVHANYRGMTLQNLDEISENITTGVSSAAIADGRMGSTAYSFIDQNNQEVATFGLGKLTNSTAQNPDLGFYFYVAQRYLNNLAT